MFFISMDTSNGLSVALFSDEVILEEFIMLRDNAINFPKVSDILILKIKEILHNNNIPIGEISFISLIKGPGFFTGIRLAIVFAKILRVALEMPIISFSASYINALHVFEKVSLKKKDIILSTVDIGKNGAVVSLYSHKLESLLEETYVESEDLEAFFLHHKINEYDNLHIVGSKQDILKNISLFKKSQYYDNIKTHNLIILGKESLKKYHQNNFDNLLLPLYAKDVDMVIKN